MTDHGVRADPVRAILLDFDGLICDTECAAKQSWHEEYAREHLTFPMALWHAMSGRPDGEELAWADLSTRLGRPVADADRRAARLERKRWLCSREPLRPGVAPLLRYAADGGTALAVVSSSPRSWVEPHLTRLGVANYFRFVVTGDDGIAPKPAPDLYLRALARLCVGARAALAFEDSSVGVRAATAAGVRCIGVPSAVGSRLGLETADLVVGNLTEIRDWTDVFATPMRARS